MISAEAIEDAAWSACLFVAPNCEHIVEGNFWASQRLDPRTIEAARKGGVVYAEDLLDAELALDAPFCLDASEWGTQLQEWYDAQVQRIRDNLETYASHPELLA